VEHEISWYNFHTIFQFKGTNFQEFDFKSLLSQALACKFDFLLWMNGMSVNIMVAAGGIYPHV
jgi:hypothetical protein